MFTDQDKTIVDEGVFEPLVQDEVYLLECKGL